MKLASAPDVPPAVLIVDDDPPLLGLLKTLIRRNGDWDIVTCRDGDEAIQELAARHFDVVLLDLMMPRRNGFDVIEYLQEHRPRQLSVVLVLSAATSEVTQRIDSSAVHAIVDKPFETGALLALVCNIIGAAERF